jgi:hypothetical protein
MAVLQDHQLDLATVWNELRELRGLRVEVFPIRRRNFEDERDTLGELAEAITMWIH